MATATKSRLKKTKLLVAAMFLVAFGFFLSTSDSEHSLAGPGVLAAGQEAGKSEPAKPKFNEKGALMRPEGYRKWVYIGTLKPDIVER